jgi:Fur family ferric uptake transcriptional regulator
MDCLSPESLTVDKEQLLKTYPERIEKVEIRIDGTCKNCEKVAVNEKMTVGGSQPNKP